MSRPTRVKSSHTTLQESESGLEGESGSVPLHLTPTRVVYEPPPSRTFLPPCFMVTLGTVGKINLSFRLGPSSVPVPTSSCLEGEYVLLYSTDSFRGVRVTQDLEKFGGSPIPSRGPPSWPTRTVLTGGTVDGPDPTRLDPCPSLSLPRPTRPCPSGATDTQRYHWH